MFFSFVIIPGWLSLIQTYLGKSPRLMHGSG
jgi:hypothetical protein